MAETGTPGGNSQEQGSSLARSPMFFMAKRAFQKIVPFTAVCELTYRCNFRCSMCYIIHENTKGELSTEEWCDVFDQLADMGTMNLELTGGEIFVRRDIWDLLAHASKRKFVIYLFTNASYINEERIARLKQFKNIMGFSISIYGGDKETFDKVTHVKGAYERVTRALELLRDNGMRVRAKTPVTRENFHTVQGIEKIAKGALCSSYSCAPLITGRDDGRMDTTDGRLADEPMREILRYEPSEGYDHANVRWESPTCTAGRSLVAISPMGDVSPCIEFTQQVGNVRHAPLAELWKSEKLDYVRNFTWSKQEKCQSCSVTQYCSPCVGINQQETGDIAVPSAETCRITTLKAEVHRDRKRLRVLPARPVREPAEVMHCSLG